MPPVKPCFPELVVLTASLLLIGTSARIHGQQLELSEAGRVEARADGRVAGVLEVERIDDSVVAGDAGDADELKDGGWDLGLVVSAAYDDNIFLSAANPESDLVLRITPKIAYVLGNDESDEGRYVRFAYQPTGVIYAEHGGENRIDQDASLLAGARGEKTSVEVAGNYRVLGDAIADTGTPTDRREYAVAIRAAYRVTAKSEVELSAGVSGTDYDIAGLSSNRDRFAEAGIRYAFSPKTRITLAYRAGRSEVDGAGDQTFQRLSAKVAWMPRKKISVDLEAGFEHRSFDLGSDNYPVVELRVGWEVREGTEIHLGAYRREEVSAFFAGQNYSLTGFSAGVSQRFSDAWTGGIEFGYEESSYSRVSGVGAAGREDRIFFIRPGLKYEISEDFSTAFYYQYSEDRSNQGAFGYENHQFGVSAAYQF